MTPRKVGSSPQSRAARQHEAMAKQQHKGLILPVNFLLTCSDDTLAAHELALLAAIADLRADVHVLLDRLIDSSGQVATVRWFRKSDRQALKHAIENEESPLEWAKRMAREGQRMEEELIPLPALEPGSAHLAAALRYQQRNIAEGKCQNCPHPLAPGSVRYCEKHLAAARHKYQKQGKAVPGSREYLYSEELQPSTHGRQPGTLASLEMNREKKTRALLAELGIPPESAAVSLKASIEAIVKCMPHSKKDALTQAELFEKACIPSKTTRGKALQQLLAARQIQRIGDGCRGNPYRYFCE